MGNYCPKLRTVIQEKKNPSVPPPTPEPVNETPELANEIQNPPTKFNTALEPTTPGIEITEDGFVKLE